MAIMAHKYLQESHAGSRLAFVPEKVAVPARAGHPKTSMLRLCARLVSNPPIGEQLDVPVARDTNPGLAARELLKSLEQGNVATIGGMGAIAMSRALKAIVIAQSIARTLPGSGS